MRCNFGLDVMKQKLKESGAMPYPGFKESFENATAGLQHNRALLQIMPY